MGNVMEVNDQQLRDKALRGDWEKAEGPARRNKLLKSRRLREEMDESLRQTMHSRSTVHRSELCVSPIQKQREISYNRRLLERINSEGFSPEVTSKILSEKQS